MQPITVAQGPTVSRGLLSALGIGMDLGGPGAAAWGSSFDDPLDPTGTGWLHGYTPVSVPCGRLVGFQPPYPCGPGVAFNRDPDAEDEDENPIPVVNLSTPPWALGDPAQPFEIEGPNIECSTFGIGGDSDAQALARSADALRDLLWRGIAHELWTGQLATAAGFTGNKRLAGPDTVVLGEGLSLAHGLYLLERAVSDQTSRDERVLIHAPWEMLTFFACESLLVSTVNSDRYFTPGGSVIAADVGYPGSSPDGDLPTPDEDTGVEDVWIYATPRVSARLDTPYARQGAAPMSAGHGVRFTTNDVTLAHRQAAAITFPCDVFGVSIRIGE